MSAVPATSLTDPRWLRAQLHLTARRHRRAPDPVLGVIWWYSASSVLVAPALQSWAATGTARDPALDAVTLDVTADGRLLDARSARPLDGGLDELGRALGVALASAIAAIEAVTGARSPALRAIATDSIANRLLWAGTPERAAPLVAATGIRMPRPRYVELGSNLVVRRASCCLIYQVGQPKCVSCPRQPPAERESRVRAALGAH
ncbi:(2Fe-2S)-binding protein [Amycolatopsis taiwanensis]|uniref:Fe-S oxidoreductase n=1 Tax=Amycolatopsis taiwanensis TaxID=342230 RepID=A0A9W6R260_9PSEU|nr:(2Fe-2S)-binding protein [Amycolatopsis taiwanensis]GLY67063.1 Fe-S oxidoreductase [Amycolatopsis taiwanensis]